jgi:RNA polymerase sigma-70 factor (ECF subfamily)
VTQEQITEGLRRKDKAALSYLYDHYADALLGVISRIVQDQDVAEEVLQDAFMRYWEKIDQYDPGKGRLFTWMMRVARNLALDKLRSKGMRQQSKSDSISDNVYTLDKSQHTESSVDAIGLENVMNELSEEQRFVVEQLYLRGYTQSEVAEEFNIPLGTVKTRLRSAMVKLRKIVTP